MSLLLAAAETGQSASPDMWASVLHGLSILRNIAVIICLASGLFFVLAGTFGVLRLPDFFTRLHAAGMTDTLGAELIMLGLIIQDGFTLLSLKLLLVSFFLLMTSPTATHAVANAAYQAGLKPLIGRYKAPSPTDIKEEA